MRSIQIQVLSSRSLEPADLQREMCQIYPPTTTQPPLFVPLSLFLKAWLHHPWCPHFNNASEIFNWLQDSTEQAVGERKRAEEEQQTYRNQRAFAARQEFKAFET